MNTESTDPTGSCGDRILTRAREEGTVGPLCRASSQPIQSRFGDRPILVVRASRPQDALLYRRITYWHVPHLRPSGPPGAASFCAGTAKPRRPCSRPRAAATRPHERTTVGQPRLCRRWPRSLTAREARFPWSARYRSCAQRAARPEPNTCTTTYPARPGEESYGCGFRSRQKKTPPVSRWRLLLNSVFARSGGSRRCRDRKPGRRDRRSRRAEDRCRSWGEPGGPAWVLRAS
jgi:hypothetical protein